MNPRLVFGGTLVVAAVIQFTVPARQQAIRRSAAALLLAASLCVAELHCAAGDGSAEYRYDGYYEDRDRISIDTHVGAFDLSLKPWLTLKGQLVYDGISGATPDGAPAKSQVDPLHYPADHEVRLAHMVDERYAGNIALTFSVGSSRITPQYAYSEEGDYRSHGASLNYSLDLFEKNTTLNAGYSHNWDTVLPKGFLQEAAAKNSDEFIIGFNQLLGRKTALTVNYVFGHTHGYLDDQYKGVVFVDEASQWHYDDINAAYDYLVEFHTFAERRPASRDKHIVFAQLTQFVTSMHASVEASYRFYHDTFGVDAHTATLAWFQKIGRNVVVAPMLRYYTQTAASFYAVSLPGDPNLSPGAPLDFGLPNAGADGGNPNPAPPEFYSADYRLSKMETFTYGVSITAELSATVALVGAYERYEMKGRDGSTAAAAYPSAHIISLGVRIKF